MSADKSTMLGLQRVHTFIKSLYLLQRQVHLIPMTRTQSLELWLTQQVIRDSNSDFRIDMDPGVHRIAPKMSWTHSLVGVSHFADLRENRPATVWEILINALKCHILTMITMSLIRDGQTPSKSYRKKEQWVSNTIKDNKQCWLKWKVIRNPYPGSDHHQKFSDSSQW